MVAKSDSRGRGTAFLGAGPRVAIAACIAALALATAPVFAAAPLLAKATKSKIVLETELTPFQPAVSPAEGNNFSFTVPGSGSAAGSSRAQTMDRAFRFTPSGQSDNPKALSVGVATRVLAAAPERARTLAQVEPIIVNPRAYDVDVSVAWKGFAINTGYSHVDPPAAAALPGMGRDALDVGLSFGGRNWRTGVQGTAEDSALTAFTPPERRYSVALGGAYMVAPRLSVSGGVRYKLAPDLAQQDPTRTDQSVYLGTNIAF